jgi:hypothetical protein
MKKEASAAHLKLGLELRTIADTADGDAMTEEEDEEVFCY